MKLSNRPYIEVHSFLDYAWVPYQEGHLTHLYIICHPNINLYDFLQQLSEGEGPLVEKVHNEQLLMMITDNEIDVLHADAIVDGENASMPFAMIEHVQICYFEKDGSQRAFVAPNNALLN